MFYNVQQFINANQDFPIRSCGKFKYSDEYNKWIISTYNQSLEDSAFKEAFVRTFADVINMDTMNIKDWCDIIDGEWNTHSKLNRSQLVSKYYELYAPKLVLVIEEKS